MVLAEIPHVDHRLTARGALDLDVVRVDIIDVHEPRGTAAAVRLELVAFHAWRR